MAIQRAAKAASGQLQPATGTASGRSELSAGAWGGPDGRSVRRALRETTKSEEATRTSASLPRRRHRPRHGLEGITATHFNNSSSAMPLNKDHPANRF